MPIVSQNRLLPKTSRRSLSGTTARPGGIGGIVGVLIEIVQKRFGFSGFRLQPRPRPGLPAKRRIAGQVARRLWNNRFRCWVQLEETIGKRSVALARGCDIRFGRTRRLETGAFIRVVADQDGRVVVAFRLVQPVLVVGDHPTIHDRPSQTRLTSRRFEHFVGRKLAEILDRRGAGSLGVRFPGAFRVGQQHHVLTRHSARTAGPERPAAL